MAARHPLALVADADPDFLRLIRTELEFRDFRVIATQTGAQALRVARRDWPDVGVFSLRLPDLDPIRLLTDLRTWGELPAILIGIGGSPRQAVQALDAGADDYLTWPFDPEELVARLHALLRRTQGVSRVPPVLRAGDIEIDFSQSKVTRRGDSIPLSTTEWRLLTEFVTHPRQILSYQELLPRVSPHTRVREPGQLRTWVYRLRQKLETDPDHPMLIKTVPGMGYIFDIELFGGPGPAGPFIRERDGDSRGRWTAAGWRQLRSHAVPL